MKTQKALVGVAIAAVVALAAMGLVFCWHCPDLIHDAGGVVSHYRFNRQLAWNGAGVCAFVLAFMVGWKRWLKAAPFVFAGWAVLWVGAHSSPMVNGSHSFAVLGPVSVEVWAVFPFAAALLTAWVAKRYGGRIKWILLTVCVSAVMAICWEILIDANRMQRIFAWWFGVGESDYNTVRAVLQMEMKQLFESAHWFLGVDGELKRMPCLFTSGASSAAAWLFGKWFVALAMALFAVLAVCGAWVWRYTPNREKRLFILIWGASVIVPAVNGPLQCLGLVPFCDISMPMVSYGGTAALMTWMGAGVLISICIEMIKGANVPSIMNVPYNYESTEEQTRASN
ncbi:MAG: FtsW/RodA/SpoVE family cell cycle protein [Kiritimatiellae bacterium]|nr:FtsW/RodA/SpoVE family cell cycle protein [Kiritimatiellia bacterium]